MSHRGRANADELIACALAAGKSHKDAAAEAGVSEKTVFRRAADPAFARRVSALRAAMVSTAAGRLADGMTAAAGVLRNLLASESEGIRLRASVALMDQAVKITELTELQQRVADLEQRLEREKQP